MGLTGTVIGVLTEDDDFGVGEGRQVQRGEHVLGLGIYRRSTSFRLDEFLQTNPILLIEFGLENGIPIRLWHANILAHTDLSWACPGRG